MIGTSLQVAKKKINFRFWCWAKSRQTCLCWDKQKTDMSVLGQTKDRHELCWDKQKSPPVQTELYVI
jgi:hypothetical protein